MNKQEKFDDMAIHEALKHLESITQVNNKDKYIELTPLYTYDYKEPEQTYKPTNKRTTQKSLPTDECINSQLDFIDLLLSPDDITLLLESIQYRGLPIAEIAFSILKDYWPWERKYTYLIPSLADDSLELDFIAELGIDIMKITERSLITREDYIIKYSDSQSLEKIKKHKDLCISLQQKGLLEDLFIVTSQLYNRVIKNGKQNNLTDNICLAITENAYYDSATAILHTIAYGSLEKACKQLEILRIAILRQAIQKEMDDMAQVKELFIEQYGFDVLQIARNCYMSRNDYINVTHQYPTLSDNLKSILLTIEQQSLPIARAELIYLKKQIIDNLEFHNIIDPNAQKEFIIKNFNCDIIGLAHNIYRARLDHKKLISYYEPTDVQNTIINLLNNYGYNYEFLAERFDQLAESILYNAKLCNISFTLETKTIIYNAIDAIKTSCNDADFIFNVRTINHLLDDIQRNVCGTIEGTAELPKESPEPLTEAIENFITRLQLNSTT